MSDASQSGFTSTSVSKGDNWFVACDDEAVYRETGKEKGQLGPDKWRPEVTEVIALYGGLEAMGGILPLKWNWPAGRRPPSPGEDEEYETDEEEAAAAAEHGEGGGKGAEDTAAGGAGFDFDEEEDADETGQITPRRPLGGQRELKGSAKKKTTDFKNVISNMQRHRQMDAARAKAAAATAAAAAAPAASAKEQGKK